MTIQLHEEYENSKSYLLGPRLLLWLIVLFRRQQLSRISSLRRVVELANQRMGQVGVSGSTVLPPHSCARFVEHGTSRTVGTFS